MRISKALLLADHRFQRGPLFQNDRMMIPEVRMKTKMTRSPRLWCFERGNISRSEKRRTLDEKVCSILLGSTALPKFCVSHIWLSVEKGLPPLPDPEKEASTEENDAGKESKKSKQKTAAPSLSFSSSKSGPQAKQKRKLLVGDSEAPEEGEKPKKKSKKNAKTLLSFGDDPWCIPMKASPTDKPVSLLSASLIILLSAINALRYTQLVRLFGIVSHGMIRH
jgi:hypothetical protein